MQNRKAIQVNQSSCFFFFKPLSLCASALKRRLQATGFRLQATALVLVLVLVLVLGFSSFRVSRGLMFDCGKSSSVC
jgi:hypothetical protein